MYLALSCPRLHLIIELSRDSCGSLLLSYNPQSPTDDSETITESAELWVRSVAKARAIRGEIYRLLNSSEDNYVLMRADKASEVWRSKIVKGAVMWGDEALGGRNVTLLISWERMGYWEGELRELPLSNVHGQRIVGGIMIDLDSDSDHDNWAEIAAQDAVSDVPCPVIAHISYTGYLVTDVYLAYLYFRSNDFPELTLQAEDSFSLVPSEVINSSQASNGAYKRVELQTGLQGVISWRLNAEQTIELAGKTVHFLLKGFGPILLGIRFFVSLYINSTEIKRTEYITSVGNRAVLNLGGFSFPETKTQLRNIRLILNAFPSTNAVLDIDALILLPNFRHLRPHAGGLMSSETLIDDGLRDELYKTHDDDHNTLNYFKLGERSSIQPYATQRFYVASRATLGKFYLNLFYRPRHI